jgi:hypothetical protein
LKVIDNDDDEYMMMMLMNTMIIMHNKSIPEAIVVEGEDDVNWTLL